MYNIRHGKLSYDVTNKFHETISKQVAYVTQRSAIVVITVSTCGVLLYIQCPIYIVCTWLHHGTMRSIELVLIHMT